MSSIKRFLFVIIIFLTAFWLLKKIVSIPSIKKLFAAKEVVIDQTPVLIKEIKSIGQLITYTSYDEVVADSVIITKGAAFINTFNMLSPLHLPPAEKKLVLIAKGKVLAGVDLMQLNESSVVLRNDSLWITLPPAKIIDAVMNPSDFETFAEQGHWTDVEVIQLKMKAKRILTERAINQNIIERAGTKAKSVIHNFLTALKYKYVEVR